jgi:hypothetical protein
MSAESERDRFLEEEREEAEDAELRDESSLSLYREREEAEGVELFESAESGLPGSALREGEPGYETLTGDRLDLQSDESDEESEASDT